MVEMIASDRFLTTDKSKVRLWDQAKRAVIKSKTGEIKKLFPDGNVWFIQGTVAKSLNGNTDAILKFKNQKKEWKDYDVKDVEGLIEEKLGKHQTSKIHI
jgi:hypothetical protein